jgi:hypothetical protein
LIEIFGLFPEVEIGFSGARPRLANNVVVGEALYAAGASFLIVGGVRDRSPSTPSFSLGSLGLS